MDELRARLDVFKQTNSDDDIYTAFRRHVLGPDRPWTPDESIALFVFAQWKRQHHHALLIERPLSCMAQGVASMRVIKEKDGLALMLNGDRRSLYRWTSEEAVMSGGWRLVVNGWMPTIYVRQQPPPPDYAAVLESVRARDVRALNRLLMATD